MEEFEARDSNEPLSAANRHFVQEILLDAQEDLDLLDNEVAHARSILDTALRRRDKGARRVGRLKAWAAPHKYMPPELLAKIFTYCVGLAEMALPVPPYPDNFKHGFSRSMAWVLTHVCSRWRKICIAEHQFWNTIALLPRGKHPRRALETAILRSGTRIIHLKYTASGCSEAVLPTILRHHNRFTSLDLEITRNTEEFLSKIPLFENLESLSIKLDNYDGIPFAGLPAPPLLRKLTLASVIPGFHRTLYNHWVDPLDSMWAQLTHLKIKRLLTISSSSMLKILQRGTVLVECSLYISAWLNPDGFLENVVLPNLEVLELNTDHKNANPYIILHALTLPSLKTFEIKGEYLGIGNSWPINDVLQLFIRSRCPLEVLRMIRHRVQVEFVLPLMRVLPDLVVEFDISTDRPLSASIVDKMISENLLPHLEHLSAWFDTGRTALALLESTWAAGQDSGIRRGDISVFSNGELTLQEQNTIANKLNITLRKY